MLKYKEEPPSSLERVAGIIFGVGSCFFSGWQEVEGSGLEISGFRVPLSGFRAFRV